MPIGEIIIHDYKRPLGGTGTAHNRIKGKLTRAITECLPSCELNVIELFSLSGEKHTHNAGNEGKLVIFLNATAKGAGDNLILPEPQTIGGTENTITNFFSPKGDGIVIVSEHGVPIAEYRKNAYQQLNIFFDLFQTDSTSDLKIFKFILSELERLVFLPKTFENSWKHTQNKETLTRRFVGQIKNQKERQLESDIRQITSWENETKDVQHRLKTLFDSIAQKRRSVDVERANIDNVSSNLINDLNLIIAHPKVKDLVIKDGKFIISTLPLYIHNGKKRYYGGNYRIEVVMDRTDIRFFGDNPRKSYWTRQDPHPHVNGNDGHACLGNTAETFAELCSQGQIYAIMLVAIDFLESVNTSDSAGKNVVNWDEVDEQGNPITVPPVIKCPRCNEEVSTLYRVFDHLDEDGDPCEEHEVCEDCRDEHYHYDGDAEEYVEHGGDED